MKTYLKKIDKRQFAFPVLIILGFLFCLIKSFCFDIAMVDGNSMYPTLHNGDLLMVKKLGDSFSIGDIVLLKLSLTPNTKEYAVKRVIAVGGDTVTIDYEVNSVYVNDQILDEPYINYDQDDPMRRNGKPSNIAFCVPDGHVFLLGDNRNYSLDSRDNMVGLVATEDIIGTVSILLPAEPR